ncbi:MAG: tryptophan synthase subunit beta [Ignavibacteriae bacterium]|nr:MAG: tryptophan synthase subunit beta [Ignavibacteriota bacterium]
MNNNYKQPDLNGKFGKYGGKFVSEILIPALNELEQAYNKLKNNKVFNFELSELQRTYNGRPTPLTFSRRLTEHYGKGKIYLKREDLCHTGAHKLNNALGQILIALHLNKKRVIAETGAGQHGVATATVCAKYGLDCCIYMGEEDIERQKLNVFRMKLLGAKVISVSSGSKTLKDATNEAIKDWIANVKDTHYIIGSVVGPHPYPMIVKDFQSVIGKEAKEQILRAEGKLPDYVLACIGGGSNAIGIFNDFIEDEKVKLIGVEAAGFGLDTNQHSATLTLGREGIFQGMKTYLLQDENGQISPVHSISAGLNYPGIGPQHSFLKDKKRVQYYSVTDKEALQAVKKISLLEGILPALETAHAYAYLEKLMPKTKKNEIVIVNTSGRGEKDLNTIINKLNGEFE